MSFSTFPDLYGFSQRSRLSADLKLRLETVSQEAVTGIKSDITKAVNGRVGEIHLLQKALSDIDLEDRINTLAGTRVDLMLRGLSGTREALNEIDTRAQVALSTGNTGAIDTITEEAEITLKNVMNAMSARHGTRNLFSGNATDTAPFASPDVLLDDIRQIVTTAGSPSDIQSAIDTYFDNPAGGFNTRVYLGGTSGATAIHLGGAEKINVDIRGNSDTIKEVLKGLSLMAASGSSTLDRNSDEFANMFTESITNIRQGNVGLINAEANIGLHAEAIEKLKTRNQAERISLTSSYQALVGRDQFEAATELKQLEVQLESSYVITSRLSNLSLINYLR